ncbi:MAG TPA: thiosulfate sulfurtransferase GlpE [bacterium]|jgi:rhodanese-related sulfurtransferase
MTTRNIEPKELQALLTSGRPYLLLDVRNAKDYAASSRRIPGALKLDAEVIGTWLAMLPREREVIVYCQHGQRLSNLVLDALRVRGFAVRSLAGGMDAWLEAEGELTAA